MVWTNLAGGNWGAAANWSPNQAPGSADDAFITNNGIYTVTANGSLSLNSLTLGGGTGQQSLAMAGNALSLSTASVVNTNGVLGLSGGYLYLASFGVLTVHGTMNWTGGSIASGSTVMVATNGLLVLAGVNGTDYSLWGAVTNAGTVRLVSGNLEVANLCSDLVPQLANLPGGLIDLQADVSIDRQCTPPHEVLDNRGTVRKSGGTGTSIIAVKLFNNGLVEAQSGELNLTGHGSGSGQFLAEAGAAVSFGGGTYQGNFEADTGTMFLGAGTNLLSGGTLTVAGSVTSSNLVLSGGTMTLNGHLDSGSTVLAGANLAGNGSFGGLLTWTRGTITNGSKLTVATNGVLVLAAVNGKDYALRGVLTNAGTVQLVSGNLQLYSGCSNGYGQLINLPGGLVDLQADVSIDRYCSSYELLDNRGTVRKSGGTGTSTINVAFNNAGLLEAQTGALYFTSSFGEAGGGFSVRINDATSWGQMLFSNVLTLGGPFTVTSSAGYVPTAGDQFQLLSFPSSSGGFTAYYGLDLGAGLMFDPRLNPTDFSLEVSTYPVDARPTLSLHRLGNNLLIWWPTAFSNYVAFTTTNLAAPAWTPESLTGPNQLLVLPKQAQKYFRLME
ncbi:MAG TPA: hypothetical protein VMU04_20375 [Candidatus Acidoferrum sp.]|nr:hypothetical protein [Candidatus Acidoferrum sp.]